MPNHRASKVGLVYWDTGFGIGRDVAIVEEVVRKLGCETRHIRTKIRSDVRERRAKFAVQAWRLLFPLPLQIHFEQIHREQFRLARRNIIFPNPEFTDPKALSRTPNLSAICCKTRHGFELLSGHHPGCVFTGFTSVDRSLESVPKDFRRFLHVAGKSDFKGTDEVLEAWRRHPEWPELTVVWSPVCTYGGPRRALEAPPNVNVISRFLEEQELLDLQNRCGIHLCPSQAEGFGHYINEALSAGAVVVTTDAPPMNEFVTAANGFTVTAEPEKDQFMSTLFTVRVDALESVIGRILETPTDTLGEMGRRSRRVFEEGREEFRDRFASLVSRLLE